MSEADAGVTSLDPTEFVAGDVTAETEQAADHAAAEGQETPTASDMGGTSRFSTFKRVLLANEPSPELTNVEDPWNPDDGGVTRIYRGFQKMVGFDGMPAIGDLAIGAMEWVHEFQLEGRSDDNDNSADDGAGDDGAADVEAADDPITAQVRASDE